jgi:hypothetical protein
VIEVPLPADVALRLHREQGRGWPMLIGLGLLLILPGVIFRLQVLFFLALIGLFLAIYGTNLGLRWLGRRRPPHYVVRVDSAGVSGNWDGAPPNLLTWSQIRQVMPNAGGHLVSGGLRMVILPKELERIDEVLQAIQKGLAAAPPPAQELQWNSGRLRVPVQEDMGERIARLRPITRVAAWVGWISFALCPVLFLLNLSAMVALIGLCSLAFGVYVGLEWGMIPWWMGTVAVVHTLMPLFRSVYRGRLARFLAALYMLVGICLCAAGALVLVAGLVGLANPLPLHR